MKDYICLMASPYEEDEGFEVTFTTKANSDDEVFKMADEIVEKLDLEGAYIVVSEGNDIEELEKDLVAAMKECEREFEKAEYAINKGE